MRILIIFFIIFALGYGKFNRNNYYDFVYNNLLIKESDNRQFESNGAVLSNKTTGAIGRGQITPIAVEDFNDLNKWDLIFTFDDMNDDFINKIVSRWIFYTRLMKYYKGDIIKMVNGYNMGIGNTDAGAYNTEFLKSIIPFEFKYWIIGKTIIKRRKDVIIIKNNAYK